MGSLQRIVFVLCCVLGMSFSLPRVQTRGKFLFDDRGERFFLRAVAYGYSTSPTEAQYWKPAMKLLHETMPSVNAIRLYHVDLNTSVRGYDDFMQHLERLGLYAIVPLTPDSGCVLDRTGTPLLGKHSCYPSCLLSFAQRVMNIFSRWNNTLAYVVGQMLGVC